MAPYAGFFYVYETALVLLEVLVGIAFAVRSLGESSRKMAILAVAYAWSAPLAVLNVIAIPGVPPDLPDEPLQVAPAIWVIWHLGWSLALIAYSVVSERSGPQLGRLVPLAFAGALVAGGATVVAAPVLPPLLDTAQHILPLYRVWIAVSAVLNGVVMLRLVREHAPPRDRWVTVSVALALLEAVLMFLAGARFSALFLFARIAGLASAGGMLGALIFDGIAVVRRAAADVAERERLAEFRMIADEMPQIVWQLTGDGRNVYANARWGDSTGRNFSDGRDEQFADAIHPDDREARDRAFAEARERGTRYEASYRMRVADGTYRYFLSRAVPIIRKGVITAWIGTSTDIEERRQIEIAQRSAYEREARDAERMRLLAATGRALSQSLDLDVVLATAAAAPVPDIADWALVNLRRDDGILVVAAAHHRDPQRAERLRHVIGNSYVMPGAKGGSNDVVATEQIALHAPQVTEELLRATIRPEWVDLFIALEPRSIFAVPLFFGGDVRGTLNLAFAESGRRYHADDIAMLEEIGRRVALAIDNAEHYAREHRVADRLQRASLPASLPKLDGVELDAVYQAGRSEAQIGGDWYDAFALDDGRLIVGVGDVMGSGLEAAVTMGAVRQAIRGAAEVCADPVAILDAADRALRKTQPDGLVTAFLGIIEPDTGTIAYASAGHPPPFVRRPDGDVDRLNDVGLPIGLRDEERERMPAVTVLEDGSLLVLYTDGLTEAQRNIDDGEQRLIAALAAAADTEHPADAIRGSVLGSEAAAEPRDDVAILTIRLTHGTRPGITRVRCDVRDGEAVRGVRATILDALRTWGLAEPALVNADLVLGELLSNVVRHAPPVADVTLDVRGDAPILTVSDRGPGCGSMPTLPDHQAESGRGLYLVWKLTADLAIGARAGGGCEVRTVLST